MTPHVQAHHHRASSSSSSHVKIVYPSDVDADGSDLEEIMAISEEEVVGKKIRILRGPRPRRKTKAQTEAAGGIATQEDRERELVGSLTTSGKYKTQGLIKKVSFSFLLSFLLLFSPCSLPAKQSRRGLETNSS